MYNTDELNDKVHELRELKRQAEELSAKISSIEVELKSEMEERNEYVLTGDDWKITWNEVTSSRFNQKDFKNAHPELYKEFITESTSRRFLLN